MSQDQQCQYSSGDTDIIQRSTQAIREDEDIVVLKRLIPESSREWCSNLNTFGNTLLQESILSYNKEAFLFLLPLQDLVTLEKCNYYGETALKLALNLSEKSQTPEQLQTFEFFATELIEYGAFIHGVFNNRTLLDNALASSSINIAKLLLKKGININFQDNEGNTSLHKILWRSTENTDEIVSFLLYYGADPFIENKFEKIPFEYAVENNCSLFVQETLFDYTFDGHTYCKIHAGILFKLAHSNFLLFSELYKNEKVTFIVGETRLTKLIAYFDSLFDIDIEQLNFVVDKFYYLIREMLIRIVIYNPVKLGRLAFSRSFLETKSQCVPIITSQHIGHHCLSYIKNIKHLSVLFESRIKSYMIMFLNSLSYKAIFSEILTANNEADAHTLLTFLLSYGLSFTKEEYDEVFLTYGYCDLFKLMLLVGSYDTSFDKNNIRSPMCRLICDVNLDLNDLLSIKNKSVHAKDLAQILEYFVDAKLTNHLLEVSESLVQYEDHRKKLLERIEWQPKVPLLVELSRNVFRKYVIGKFKVKNESQFHFIINWLPVSTTHKKIITYETQLY